MALTRINNQALTNVTSAGLPTLSSSNMPAGSVLQVVYNRSDVRNLRSGANNYSLSEIDTAITPKESTSILIVQFTLCIEGHHDQTLKITKDGSVVTTAGYEGYNNKAGNQRWSGIGVMPYDGDANSTPENIVLTYYDLAGNTTSRTYGVDARTASSTNRTVSINRALSHGGQDSHENGVSFCTITEVKV